jgi:uncharacterized protein
MDEFSSRCNFLIEGNHGKPILTDVYEQLSDGSYPVVIFSHGFKGFKDWGPFNLMAHKFASAGFVFVKFNFAFNGTTPSTPEDFTDLNAFGENNFTKELDDLDCIINWVMDNSIALKADNTKIYLAGHSRGGAITLLKASEDQRIASAAAWAPVADFNRHISPEEIRNWKRTGIHYVENSRTGQLMPLHLQLYEDYIKNHRRLNIRKAVRNLNKSHLLIHGSADETIPFQHAVELFNENPFNSRLLEIKNASHTFGAAHPQEGKPIPPDFDIVVRETIRFFHSR